MRAPYHACSSRLVYYLASDSHVLFQHADWVGTVRYRTRYDGSLEGSFTSLPFGDSQSTASGSDTDAQHFAGLDFDTQDLQHATFRHYSATSARWLRPDPYRGSYSMANPQTNNRYSYTLNSPLSFRDPSGHLCMLVDDDDGGEGDVGCGGLQSEDSGGGSQIDSGAGPDTVIQSVDVTAEAPGQVDVEAIDDPDSNSLIDPTSTNSATNNGRRCIANCGKTDPNPSDTSTISEIAQVPMEIPIEIPWPWLPPWLTQDPTQAILKSTRWSKFPGCSVQYQNDIAICGQRQTFTCWSSASQRLAHCNATGGEVGWPPLSK